MCGEANAVRVADYISKYFIGGKRAPRRPSPICFPLMLETAKRGCIYINGLFLHSLDFSNHYVSIINLLEFDKQAVSVPSATLLVLPVLERLPRSSVPLWMFR